MPGLRYRGYNKNVLRDVLARGLADEEIQLDLLGKKNQNISVKEVLQIVEAKESGTRSAGKLLQSQGAEAIRSQYIGSYYCGKTGHHYKASPKRCKQLCPAFGTTSHLSGQPNHVGATCKSKDKPIHQRTPPPTDRQAKSAIFEALCNVTTADHALNGISLDHHLYNNMNDHWIQWASQPQLFISHKASIHPDDYVALGYKPVTTAPKSIELHTMADTGCQSGLESLSIIHRFRLS